MTKYWVLLIREERADGSVLQWHHSNTQGRSCHTDVICKCHISAAAYFTDVLTFNWFVALLKEVFQANKTCGVFQGSTLGPHLTFCQIINMQLHPWRFSNSEQDKLTTGCSYMCLCLRTNTINISVVQKEKTWQLVFMGTLPSTETRLFYFRLWLIISFVTITHSRIPVQASLREGHFLS